MDDRFELILRAQQGDNDACEQLLKENAGLIWSIVRRFTGHGVETDDLYQLGSLGFLKAVRSFDINYGTQFSTYAVPKISGEIRRFLRDDGMIKVSRSVRDLAVQVSRLRTAIITKTGTEPSIGELAQQLEVTPEEIAMCENATAPTDSLQREVGEDGSTMERILGDDGIEDSIVDSVVVRECIQKLPEKERKVILLRYYRSLTQQRCAELLGISQVQVSRLERRAIARMREHIEV
ncbi:MAG: sigma-70 family RNA polymerase sigma factor [Butyricicoccaceae bacterium]